MSLEDDIRNGYKAEDYLMRAGHYKRSSKFNPVHVRYYIHQLRQYISLRDKIENENIRNLLEERERELLR